MLIHQLSDVITVVPQKNGIYSGDIDYQAICHSCQRKGRMWPLAQPYKAVMDLGYKPRSNIFMMTSSNGNIFRVTGNLCGEFTGHRSQRSVTRSFDDFCDLRLHKRLSNNREAGDLRHHRAHYDVIVMLFTILADVLQMWICISVTHSIIYCDDGPSFLLCNVRLKVKDTFILLWMLKLCRAHGSWI